MTFQNFLEMLFDAIKLEISAQVEDLVDIEGEYGYQV